jgi:hypothetical protein
MLERLSVYDRPVGTLRHINRPPFGRRDFSAQNEFSTCGTVPIVSDFPVIFLLKFWTKDLAPNNFPAKDLPGF